MGSFRITAPWLLAACVGACAVVKNAEWQEDLPAEDAHPDASTSYDLEPVIEDGSRVEIDPKTDSGADAASDAGPDVDSCPDPTVPSLCDNDASLIVGRIRVAEGIEATSGDLTLLLAYYRFGVLTPGAFFGYVHTGERYPDVDLSGDGIPFEIDLCEGGELWSEEFCEYSLVAFLEPDDEADFIVDVGEPATRELVTLSCTDTGPQCVDLVLDCLDGDPCVGHAYPGACQCSEERCGDDTSYCL